MQEANYRITIFLFLSLLIGISLLGDAKAMVASSEISNSSVSLQPQSTDLLSTSFSSNHVDNTPYTTFKPGC
ncbi:hypothetical protein KFE98_13910 [bacterium SCSIO 12741]|nr:hypothetical protein KFE98_13910 [bacterium SCSIO 12741]